MEKITISFEDEALKEIFLSWFSDGGGEYNFSEAFDGTDIFLKVDYSRCFPAHGYSKEKHGAEKIIIKYGEED